MSKTAPIKSKSKKLPDVPAFKKERFAIKPAGKLPFLPKQKMIKFAFALPEESAFNLYCFLYGGSFTIDDKKLISVIEYILQDTLPKFNEHYYKRFLKNKKRIDPVLRLVGRLNGKLKVSAL